MHIYYVIYLTVKLYVGGDCEAGVSDALFYL